MIFSKQTALITILWVVSLTVSLIYLRPNYQEIKSLYNTNLQKTDELKRAEDFLEQLDKLVSQRKELEARIENAKNALPVSKEIPELITQAASIASDNGLILKSLNITEASGPKEKAKTLSVSVIINGTYNSLKSFIKSLENNLRIMDISSISFKSAPKPEDLMEFKVNFKTYYQ